MNSLPIKPLSVNECWQGKRFKTPAYQAYEEELLFKLPQISMPAPPFEIQLSFGLSNGLSDFDNPVKPFVDILQKKYGFNDKHIMRATIEKVPVKKGQEYIAFQIRPFRQGLDYANAAQL